MAHNHSDSSYRRHIRQKITDMVHNIEAVIVNINNVLGEVTLLVGQIDNIAERMQSRLESKVNTGGVNRNYCDNVNTPAAVSSQSKLTILSPYMDYSYLELTSDRGACNDNYVHSFTYNEKYPLWMQCGSWKTSNSVSDISEVTAGSDSSNLIHNESDDNSWKSVSIVGRKNEDVIKSRLLNKSKCKFEDVDNYIKCCSNAHNHLGEKYCGVYELIMEEQLEQPEELGTPPVGFVENNLFTESECSSKDLSQECILNSDFFRETDFSEYVGIAVLECSDSDASLSN